MEYFGHGHSPFAQSNSHGRQEVEILHRAAEWVGSGNFQGGDIHEGGRNSYIARLNYRDGRYIFYLRLQVVHI